MIGFINNRSEAVTWTLFQNQKHKIQNNIFKIATSFLNFKLQIIALAQGHRSCKPIH